MVLGSIIFDSSYSIFYTWSYTFFNHERRPKIYFVAIICRFCGLLITLGMLRWFSRWIIMPQFVTFIIEWFIIHGIDLEGECSTIKLRFQCFPRPNQQVMPFRNATKLKKELRYSMNIVSLCMFIVLVLRLVVGILIGSKIGAWIYLSVMMMCSVIIINVMNCTVNEDEMRLKQLKMEYLAIIYTKLQPTPITLTSELNMNVYDNMIGMGVVGHDADDELSEKQSNSDSETLMRKETMTLTNTDNDRIQKIGNITPVPLEIDDDNENSSNTLKFSPEL